MSYRWKLLRFRSRVPNTRNEFLRCSFESVFFVLLIWKEKENVIILTNSIIVSIYMCVRVCVSKYNNINPTRYSLYKNIAALNANISTLSYIYYIGNEYFHATKDFCEPILCTFYIWRARRIVQIYLFYFYKNYLCRVSFVIDFSLRQFRARIFI